MTLDLCDDQAQKLPPICDTEFWNFGFPVSPFPLNRWERCLLMGITVIKKSIFTESTTLGNEDSESLQLTSKKTPNQKHSALIQQARKRCFPQTKEGSQWVPMEITRERHLNSQGQTKSVLTQVERKVWEIYISSIWIRLFQNRELRLSGRISTLFDFGSAHFEAGLLTMSTHDKEYFAA